MLPHAERAGYEIVVRSRPWQIQEGGDLPSKDNIAAMRWLESPEQAQAICAQQHGQPLRLSIDTLNPETARVLASYPGELDLVGISRLEPQTAQALAERPAGRLRLTLGLNCDSIADFAALAPLWSRRDANLRLPAMTRLDDEAAEVLGRTQGTLCLPNLARLSKRQADLLAQGNLVRLELDGLGDAALSEELARSLCSGQLKEISLSGLSHTSPALGQITAHPWASLQLDGLRQLPLPLAASLCKANIRSLKLNGLTELGLATVRALCGEKRPFHLSLNGLSGLDNSVVGVLVSNEFRQLEIRNVSLLSDVAKQTLREFGNYECPAIKY